MHGFFILVVYILLAIVSRPGDQHGNVANAKGDGAGVYREAEQSL